MRTPKLSRKWRERLGRWREGVEYQFGRPGRFVTGIFKGIGGFFSKAWGTRNLRYMLQGVPALLAIVGVFITAALVWAQKPGDLSRSYRAEAQRAYMAEDFDLARSSMEKAIQLEPDNLDFRFVLGVMLARKSQEDKQPADHAFAVMRKLAPDTATGYAPAHVWLGNYILGNIGNVGAAESHFTRAYQAAVQPSANDEVKRCLPDAAMRLAGIYYLSIKNYAEAEKYALKAIEKLESRQANTLRLGILAPIYRATNRPDDATRTLETCVRYFNTQVNASIDDKEARGNLAAALVGLERFPEAADVLTKGAVLGKDRQLLQLASDVFALWEIYLAKKSESSLAERLKLIQQGLEIYPSNQVLIGRLVVLSRLTGPEGDKARSVMLDMVAKGQSTFVIYNLLGMHAYSEGKLDEARELWEKASGSADLNDPNSLVVANNLAWMIAHDKNPALDKALAMSNQVVEKIKKQVPANAPIPPGVARFFGTRGWILYKMGRYAEALPDLEKGRPGSPDDPEMHQALYETYKQLGNTTQAEAHRRRLEELKAKAAPPPAVPDVNPALPAAKPAALPDPAKPKGG